MRAVWILLGTLMAAMASSQAQSAPQEDPGRLVREASYNELQDHGSHRYWRYWVRQEGENGSTFQEQVETVDGPVNRLLLQNGQPLDEQNEETERARLLKLRNSPSEQANARQSFRDDEQHIEHMLALLPDAFLYNDAGIENGARHLSFTPNPGYSAHSIEARVFHQLTGDLWIDLRMKRIRRFEGRLHENVDFGFGMLGRVNKGSWLSMTRVQVAENEWKTDHYESHINGRALIFKSVVRDISETRGDFEIIPPAMSLQEGLKALDLMAAARQAAIAEGRIAPAALVSPKTRGPGL